MASYLVTGASRGLGYAIIVYLNSLPEKEVRIVFAAARSEPTGLKELISQSSGRIVYIKMDTTSEIAVKVALSEVEDRLNGKGLDVLINNAGVTAHSPGWTETLTPMNDIFNVNVTGTNIVTTLFLPLLRQGVEKKVINLGSTLGSIGMAAKVKDYPFLAYKVSKAGLNSLTVQWALALANEGFIVLSINPGWVKTDMGGGEMADLTPAQAAKAVVDFILKAGPVNNGTFPMIKVAGWEESDGINQYDGETRPW